jgi:hypothetical protein
VSPIDEIFARMDLQNIREMLLHGVEQPEICADTYEKRLKDAESQAVECVRKWFPKTPENEEMIDKMYAAFSAEQDVYMEIGIIAGVRLAFQIFDPGRGKI